MVGGRVEPREGDGNQGSSLAIYRIAAMQQPVVTLIYVLGDGNECPGSALEGNEFVLVESLSAIVYDINGQASRGSRGRGSSPGRE